MMDHPSPPRYWILKDTFENDSFLDQSSTTRIIAADIGIQKFDVAYFWRQEDSSYFYAWGRFENEPTQGAIGSGKQVIGVWTIPIDRITDPIMTREVEEDPAFSDIELRDPKIEVFEISEIQAAALNRLIRKHGSDPPPYPIVQPSDESETHIGDQPTNITVDKLLERGPSQMSILTREIVKLAGHFANQREQNRDRVTTSCLLFAAVELGPPTEGAEPDNASQFLFHWLSVQRHDQYETAFETFINPQTERQRGIALLTMRAMRVFELAERVAAFVRRDSVTEDRRKIYARDLVGALLITMATDERSGAAKRLRRVEINIDKLRQDYLAQYLNSDKNPEDDLERWQKILIELQPVPQLPVETPLAEIKQQLAQVNADTPSLVNHLNTEAEVRGFANIVAARKVETPLSIGLFGDWGSGKSTFMKQMQRAVEGIATKVREQPADQKSVFLGNIVQIEFNAWHYVEANLWASLVSHIFDNLSFSEEKEEKANAEKRKQLLLSKLSSTLEEQRKAELTAKTKQEEYQRANNELQEARRQQDSARVELTQVLSESIWPEVKRLIAANPQAAGAIKDARDLLNENDLSEEELRGELRASRNTLGHIQWRLKAMKDDPRRFLIIIAILLVTFLLPLLLGFLISRFFGWQWLQQTIAGVTPLLTLIGGIIAWVRTKRETANAFLKRLDQAEQELDTILLRARSSHDAKIETLQKQVSTVEGEIQKATERVKELDKEKTEVLKALREMEPARVLENFVRERASSDDYRKLLGVVALIRRDFKQLSDMLRDQDNQELRKSVAEILKRNEEQAAPAAASASLGVQLAGALAEQIENQATETTAGLATNTEAVAVATTAAVSASGNGQDPAGKTFENQVEEKLKDYRIDRIVLYIDDLDRCPPKQVVDVLQAIHLLLAFELFVVVVGVDARWVRHALRKHYPEMLDEDPDDQNGKKDTRWTRAATPRDYVEKIFQIPFWIKPMEPDDSEKLFKGLIPDEQLAPISTAGKTPSGIQSTAGSTSPTSGSSSDSSAEKTEITQEVETETTQTVQAGSSMKTGQSKVVHDDESKAGEFDLSPESLLLDVNERNHMVAIRDIIGKSPRTVKRFVNIYRIIKAGLDAKRLAAFKGTNGREAEYPAVLVLLSIAHGQPELTPTFFRALKQEYQQNANLTLKTLLAKPPVHFSVDVELKESWEHLLTDLNAFCDKEKIDIPLETLNKWLPVIVRYTFQLGRLSGEIRESSIQ